MYLPTFIVQRTSERCTPPTPGRFEPWTNLATWSTVCIWKLSVSPIPYTLFRYDRSVWLLS